MTENAGEAPTIHENKRAFKLVGIEIGIIIFVIIVVVGALNYFNIYSISKNYPDIFGFLPHQPFAQYGGVLTPSPTPIQSALSISEEEAQGGVTRFARSIFRDEVLPPTIEVERVKGSNGAVTDLTYFTAQWNTDENAEVFLGYNYEDGFQDKSVLIKLPEFTEATVGAARNGAQEFFSVTPGDEWKCGSAKGGENTVRVCENFWTDTALVKRGVGMTTISSENIAAIFYCELNPGTISYESTSSCSGRTIEFE